ncbi:MAG: HAMP domain-containing protein [Anaerolineae bacterium]|nr:HAMP domain-containing protein [Anaerolineae bacterium]
MSIRLRLTLLYSAILALTLLVFCTVLYVAQSRSTLAMVEHDLEKAANPMAMGWARAQLDFAAGPLPSMAGREGPEGDQARRAFQPLMEERRSRDILRILDAQGQPFTPPDASGVVVEEALPISDVGLAHLQDGEVWVEISHDEEGRVLVYNHPVTFADGEVIGIVQMGRSLADRDRSLRSLGITLLGGSLLTTLIAFGVGWTLSGVTLHPIQRITQTAREIGEARDFSSRVQHVGPDDELGRLATTFNEMLVRLEDTYQQLAHALQVQRDFVADVSHELRTPLTTIRGNLALLQREPPLPQADQKDILNDLISETERLIRLVTDLLALARADAGKKFELGPVEVHPLAEDVCRQARLLSSDREIHCNGALGLTAWANADVLRQVLLILLDNAVKHAHGPVEVFLGEDDTGVVVCVQDHGPGVSPEMQDRIFDRFYRGDTSRSTPGFGLGLAIARALTEAQHGSIAVESEMGKGCAFFVKLPKNGEVPQG